MPAHYPLPTICHLMPCQMSIALRAKTVRDLCAKDEPCGGLNPKVAKSAKCGANGEDRWKKMWILVAQVPRCCPTLVAHCSLAMQYLSQKGGKKIIKAKDSDRGLCTFPMAAKNPVRCGFIGRQSLRLNNFSLRFIN